jgi:methyl-accepting chemotaxis protein
VKALAEQTGKATGEIGQQISDIQSATRESVAAINRFATRSKSSRESPPPSPRLSRNRARPLRR